jgi:hypothetical protein
MPKPEILRTIVAPDGDGTAVEIHISDGSPPHENGAIPITLALRVGAYELPLVAHLQHEAVNLAIKLLVEVGEDLDMQMRSGGRQYNILNPRPAKSAA